MTLFNIKQSNGIEINLLPNEVIHSILQYLSIPDILILSSLHNHRLSKLANQVLLEKINGCHLRLCFDQENHWRFTVDFKFITCRSNRLAFIPVKPVCIRMYTSKFLRKPILHHISFVGPDFPKENQHLLSNLLKSAIVLDVKSIGLHQQFYSQKILFAYKVSKTPENVMKSRSGERWIEPLGFECSFNFLSQRKNKLQKVFDILHNKPIKRQIDENSVTSSSTYNVLGNKIYPKSIRSELLPILGGFYTNTPFVKSI